MNLNKKDKKKLTMAVIAVIAVLVLLALACIASADWLTASMMSVPMVFGMAALTNDRKTSRRDGQTRSMGVAATKKIFAGSLVARDANGYATPGATATTLRGIGRAEAQADNSSGANGAISVEVSTGVFKFANSTAADEITDADIGSDCYIVDDQTVAKTNGGATRSVAGTVFKVDADGVWVKFD